MREGFKRKIERLKTLTDSEIEGIHKATLSVLSETGCRFESERALKLLEKNGCKVDEETMAVGLINEVGPVPGTFLNKKHTRDNWKKEYYVPLCADRLSYKEWISTGKKTAIFKAKEKYEEIIAAHKPVPITSEQDKEINRILKEAKSYYKKKGLL